MATPTRCMIVAAEPDVCERCRSEIPAGEERHLIYGAVWCSACADDPDQYDDPADYDEHRGGDLRASILP
jgi:hypothetical protein